MLKRCLFALLVACSSRAPQPRADVAPIVSVREAAAFRTQIAAAVREPVAAWSLTASDGSGLALTSVEAKAVIEGPLAFTELHLRFHNAEDRIREGTFSITLPSGAAISRFAMQEGDLMKEAEVVPKMLARRAYDDFLHRRIDPALLEKAPGNQFTARVFPIAGRSDKHLVISYSQELTNGGYMLPLRGLPKIGKVDVEVQTVAADGSRHTQRLVEKAWLPDRDFATGSAATTAVRDGNLVAGVFDVVPTFTEHAMNGGDAALDKPAQLTLLVDTSASRALGFARYLASVEQVVRALDAKYPGLKIDVIAFDQTAQQIYTGAALAFGDAALVALAKRGPAGASDLAKAASLAKGRTVLITDGVVTAGREGVELTKAFAAADRIDVLLVGGIREERVARSLTRAGKRAGDVFDLDHEDVEPIAAGLGERVRVDVPVEVENATWFYPKTLPSVRNGTQVMVYAKLKSRQDAFSVRIGQSGYTAPTAPATPALLERAAARVEIEELEVALAATPAKDVTTASQLRKTIESKSVASRIVSSETTMLVLDTEDDYARYNIDRKSLANILVVGPSGLEQTRRTFMATRSTPPASVEVATNEDTPNDAGEGQYKMNRAPQDPQAARKQALEAARAAGTLGATSLQTGGFASLTATADISSGFDDTNVYGGLLGMEAGVGQQRANTGGNTRHGAGAGRGGMRARASAAPAVSIGMPVAQGSLDKNIIKRYIKRRINQISYCYERELLAKPTLEGTVTTQFLIAAGGKVQSVTATGVDETVARCVADVIKTIEFPTVTDGNVQVNYPFTFRLSGSTNTETTTPSGPPVPEPAPVTVAPEPYVPPPSPPIGAAPIDALDGKLQVVMQTIAKKQPAEALAFATKWRDAQPGDVLAWVALGEALEASGDKPGAARAYGSIIDLFGARAEYRRFAGERLERTGERALAIDTYRRAVADRPDQLTGHRLLAYAHLRAGDHAAAFAAMLAGVDESPAANRYAGAPKLFARDAGMIATAYIAAHVEKKDEIMAALRKRNLSPVTTPSTRFLLYWETDANDVDLHIRDKSGEEAFFSSPTLSSGGELYADVTTGFGPECFEIVGKLPAAPYELGVHYYAQGPMGYGMGLLQIERFDGRTFTFEDRPYIIMRDDARISLGKVR